MDELEKRIEQDILKHNKSLTKTKLKYAAPVTADIIEQLSHFLFTIENEFSIKEKLSKEDFIEYLQGLCYEIHNTILDTEYYVLINHNINEQRLKRLISRYLKLNIKYDERKSTLLNLGSELNDQLEDFYDDIDSKLFVKEDILKNPNTEQLNKLKAALKLSRQSVAANLNPEEKNPYPEIFVDYNSYKLFNRLHDEYKDEPKPLVNYSYIYRKMYKDGLIKLYFKPNMFREWLLNDPFNIDIPPLKQIGNISAKHREANYNKAKQLILMD